MATISLSRLPIREDAERKNEFTCRISPIPSAPAGTKVSANSAWKEGGPAPDRCRDRGENSNAVFAQWLIHSGFIAAIEPWTVKFFSRRADQIDLKTSNDGCWSD
jgi:hypothetical protein